MKKTFLLILFLFILYHAYGYFFIDKQFFMRKLFVIHHYVMMLVGMIATLAVYIKNPISR